MEDRRESPRIHTNLAAQFATTSGVHKGTVINGSVGGCFVLAQVEEPGDEPVELAIELPNGRRINLSGEVAFYLPTRGFGLHFTAPSAGDNQAMLKMWLDYLNTLQQ